MNPPVRPSLPLFLVVTVVAVAAGYFFGRPSSDELADAGAAAASGSERTIKFYQSPMHPWITSDQPGRCTICGMALVAVYEGDAGFGDGETVKLSESTAAVIGVATAVAHETDLSRTLRVNGTFETDHTRHRVLTARVPGRIETLSVDQVGQIVAAGDPLATLYSTAMLTAQRIYLERLAVGTGAISASEISAARERLLDLGATDADIERLEQTRRPEAIVTVRAPFAGTVISRGEKAYAGAYVNEAESLFELGDLSTLWFVLDVYESDLDLLRVGQAVTVTPAGSSGDPRVGYISFIDPNLDAMTRTAKARVVMANPDGSLRHRQTATAQVTIPQGHALTVPRSAVLFTRAEPTVFVALPDQAYLPRTVTLGRATPDNFEITAGLQPGDRVVTRAALLLEGQAQLAAPMAMAAVDEMPMPHAEPAADIAALEPLIFAAADAAAVLANDDLTGYIETLPAVHAAWSAYMENAPDAADGPLAEKVNALIDGPTLKEAREPFELFSTEIADLARAAGLHHAGKVSIFQCPMSPVLGTGRWVQRTDELRNPFYGEMMLTCGEKLD
ncbi:efflux RND transporter periplasmic adaptor subunit [Synoicihabitans lomoniglobus]|uniref:Efflux RND transporter periplasmic adaptor subunit n=1 Tax=Synoicihabitans lomoniglobus TaxID=2909285 RepID=A0AAF0CN18_9BACT|nr:efflux RND transporter periplasmic adaptor subunit [Opitutaceae bacterium LMO-M01]WED63845.1 efflux RND transporter periplasmic adaptor subunit [Opitutaceae bacterium LMO-M01]